MAKIELSTYLENLRTEIEKSVKLAEGKSLRFFNDRIELEIEIGVELETEGGGEAKFRFLVFDLEADAQTSRKSHNKQILKLSLIPSFENKKDGVWLSNNDQKMSG